MRKQIHTSDGDNVAGDKVIHESNWVIYVCVVAVTVFAIILLFTSGAGKKTVGIQGDHNTGNNVSVHE